MTKRANGEGSIYQRKDGRYAASLSIGRGKRKHFLGHSRAEVASKLAEATVDLNKGVPVVSSNQTVAQYLDAWLVSAKASVRPRTHESYALNVRRLQPLLGKQRLSALKPANVERAYGELLESGLSRRTVIQAHTVLHNALKKALQWGLIGRNPTEAVSVPRPERREMHVLSEEQVMRLFQATQHDEQHALWVLLVTTGLRLGEALGLKWEDVDLANSRLTVQRALQRQKEHGITFVEPKTSRSRRMVYFSDGTADALKEHRRKQNQARLMLGGMWNDNSLVFCRGNGRPLDPSRMSQRLHLILKKAGLPSVRVHDLRHTAATLHLERGENPKVVQELLGHSNIATTMDIYSHVTPAIHAAAAAKMQSLFANV
jgi:integrase